MCLYLQRGDLTCYQCLTSFVREGCNSMHFSFMNFVRLRENKRSDFKHLRLHPFSADEGSYALHKLSHC